MLARKPACTPALLLTFTVALALVLVATPAAAVRFDDIVVDSAGDDTDDDGTCTLREAIFSANQAPANDDCHPGASAVRDTISFAIASGPRTIAPLQPLPRIVGAVLLDGTSQPGFAGSPLVTLDGWQVAGEGPGLLFGAGDSSVRGLQIRRFPGDGIRIETAPTLEEDGVSVGGPGGAANRITGNGGAGVRVVSGYDHHISDNSFADNGGLGVDLGPEGPTPNDEFDLDDGANGLQNAPTIESVTSDERGTRVRVVALTTLPNQFPTGLALSLWASASCDPSGFGEGRTQLLSSESLSVDADGRVEHRFDISPPLDPTTILTALASEKSFGSSEFSACASAGGAVAAIPTLGEWGFGTLVSGLALLGWRKLRKQRTKEDARPVLA